jgi:hypothetical protein
MRGDRNLRPGDYLRFAEAAAALSLAALLIALLPFRILVRTFRWGRAPGESQDRQAILADQLALAVERASRRVPWRSVCFDQGLAMHWMLRRRGYGSILHYGIRQGEAALGAHVWVSLDGRILVGADEAAGHACVASFPADRG